ncbi:DUF1508 domain-containing protein [Changchengzhania lutea]|uniref:DUF1508 domain-containing protein n=1 Tax=Changchengzhania lutea TaxID=2049305 RepID=UPI00115E8ECA
MYSSKRALENGISSLKNNASGASANVLDLIHDLCYLCVTPNKKANFKKSAFLYSTGGETRTPTHCCTRS